MNHKAILTKEGLKTSFIDAAADLDQIHVRLAAARTVLEPLKRTSTTLPNQDVDRDEFMGMYVDSLGNIHGHTTTISQ